MYILLRTILSREEFAARRQAFMLRIARCLGWGMLGWEEVQEEEMMDEGW